MSQRSILEFNHDYAHRVGAEPEEVFRLLTSALASGSKESWEPLRRYGIHRIVQCHHSDDRKVVVGKGVLEREYQIP